MMMTILIPARRLAAALLLGLCFWPGIAHAWWNEEWTARKPLRIDTSAAGGNVTSPIGPAVILVRLHAGNFRFDQAKEDGSDVRFVASDDKTPLAYHFEKYDALLGEALAWVALPDLKPGSKSELWIYSHNPKASSTEDARGTWDKPLSLVYHFADHAQPGRDSSTWGNHASGSSPGTEGALIGAGLRLDGKSSLAVPAGPSLLWAAGAELTWSAWIKPAEVAASGAIFTRREGANALVIGLEEGKPFVEVASAGGVRRAVSPTAVPSAWHHLAITAGDALTVYLDGAEVATVAAALPALSGPSQLGGASDTETAPPIASKKARKAAAPAPGFFKGDLDELEIANVVRSAGYLQLAVAAQGIDPSKLISTGTDEESASASTGYFAVIIKSVTLDGWVVIGLLAIMAVVSWMVMVRKTLQLGAVERANDRFLARFREESERLVELINSSGSTATLGGEKVQLGSSLYRLFQVGGEEIRKRTRGGEGLSTHAVESIRASLDATLVRENQTLSRQMVLLTIAISGGPFLGLLGTVVGVMITFAAIAAAGEVNVNAIAPGIAAALVATVAGLAVAIPALFGYNWLLTKVKNVVATQQVFVDELVTRVAEAYSDRDRRRLEGARPAIVAAEQAS